MVALTVDLAQELAWEVNIVQTGQIRCASRYLTFASAVAVFGFLFVLDGTSLDQMRVAKCSRFLYPTRSHLGL